MSYPVGTLCLIIGSVQNSQNVGKECTTVSPLFEVEDNTVFVNKLKSGGHGYLVQIKDDPDPVPWFIKQPHLIKIDPDPEQDFDKEHDNTPLDKLLVDDRELVYVER